ncbi:SAB domain [Moritella viscosa]|nr:SAB domain [Moritella viscosa]
MLDKYTVDFQKPTVKDYRVDAQQKLIKQQDEIKKLDKASINEQITICKTYKE